MVEKITRQVDIPMVKLEIEISEDFFNQQIEVAKKKTEASIGREMSYGEYIEECMVGLIQINMALRKEILKEAKIPEGNDNSEPDGMYG